MPNSIITTKLHVPPHSPDLVPRPRLVAQLNQNGFYKFTLISAPAGFGKTTMISHWLKNQSLQVGWLSLDENDNTPIHFLGYLIAALRPFAPHIREVAQEIGQMSQTSFSDSLMSLLINDLSQAIHPFTLVLDDYHVITNQAIHELMSFLLTYMPPQMRLIIITRVDPPLPLPRLRARRQLVELRADDLRFTVAETTELLNKIMGLNLTETEIRVLDKRTEGWITGLQLANLAMQRYKDKAEFINNFNGSHQYILDYLNQEILSQQPPAVQTFLLKTAILGRLTASLCNAITGHDDSQQFLDLLSRLNLFLIPLDDQRQWYRYHQLFADLLYHQLKTTYPDHEIIALHQHAARWYQSHDQLHEAINHAIIAQDIDLVEELITTKTIHKQVNMLDLLNWLDNLPEAWVAPRPQLNIMYAWAKFSTGHFRLAQIYLQRVEQHLGLTDDNFISYFEQDLPEQQLSLLTGVIALKAQICLIQNDIERSIHLSQLLLSKISLDAPLWRRGIITLNLGTAYWLLGDLQSADQVLRQFKDAPPGDGLSAIIAANNLAELQRMYGQYRRAAILYEHVLQKADTEQLKSLLMITGMAHAELGNILYEWNDLAGAQYHLTQGVKLGREGAGLRVLMVGYFGLGKIYLAEKKYAEVLEIITELEQLLPLDSSSLTSFIKLLQVQLWLVQGDVESAKYWVYQQTIDFEKELNLVNQFEYIVIALTLIMIDELNLAISLLNHLLTLARQEKLRHFTIIALTFLALAYQAKTDHESEALAALSEALVLAEPEGYIRMFVDQGAPMTALLLKLVETSPAEQTMTLATLDYIKKLLRHLNIGFNLVSQAPQIKHLIDPPTPREIEILQLMASGFSNQAITNHLYISKNTLKTHLKHIYRKLAANNRVQAVAKAKVMNLL